MSESAWPMIELADVIIETQYGTAAKSNENEEGQPVLRMNNLTYEGRVDTTDLKWVDLPAVERDKLSLRRGDILFNRTNSRELVGKTAVWDGPAGFTFAGYLVRLRVREERLMPAWLSAFLNSPVGKAILFRIAKPSINMANISASDLLRVRIPIAPLEYQGRAVAQLEKADAIRLKRRKAVALADELLRSAFLEMFGDSVANPKGWPVRRLGELLEKPLRNGLSPASGGAHTAHVLTLSAITRGRYDAASVKDGMFAVEPWDDVRLDERDFLICRGNGNIGLVGRGAFPTITDASVVFPDTMIAARVDRGRLLPAYLESIWKSARVRKQLEAGARTTNGTHKVNQTVIESIEIPVPGLREQESFAVLERRVSALAARQNRALADSCRLFDALVGRAFHGEVASPTAAAKRQLALFDAGP